MECTCNHKHTPSFNINSVFKGDPTRTLTLRNTFSTELAKRFRKIKELIKTSIIQNDCFGLTLEFATGPFQINTQAPIQYQQFAFERNPAKVQKFMDWLRTQVDDGVLEILPGQQLGTAVESAWTNKYIQSAYQKGMIRGRQELNNAHYQDVPLYDTFSGNLNRAFNSPFHADKVGLIYTRAFENLKGITDEMGKQISGVLAQGIAEGWGPAKIARDLKDRVDKIGITRAKILARTEIIRAHHVATIQEYRNWGAVGVTVQAEWATAGDKRVCPICKALQGKVFELDKIEGMIPRHPQCRCLALPLDITDN